MKFQADAHISIEMVELLRRLGHDCLDGFTLPPRLPDLDLLTAAARDDRIVITADKDFGELVIRYRIPCPAVVLIRIDIDDEQSKVAYLASVWPAVISRLPGNFVTVKVGSIRSRRLAGP